MHQQYCYKKTNCGIKIINMKTFKLFSLITIVGLASIGRSSAQATGNASASATIITPISITKQLDMNFGNIATNGTVGTVILAPDGSRTLTGGVTFPLATGTVTPATFQISGVSGFTYSITLPTAITIASGANSMIVNNFTSTPTATGTLTGGSDTIKIGSTLNIVAAQVEGAYTTDGNFNVVVNYN